MVEKVKFVVTAEEMKEYDNNTITKIGIPALVLMERAALKMQEEILRRQPQSETVLIVSGTGNNGADGLALARMLSEHGCKVICCIIGNLQKATEQFSVQLGILEHYPVKLLQDIQALEVLEQFAENSCGFDVVVDALFGVGLSRTVAGDYAKALECMNAIRGLKVAADIASGISADNGKVLGAAFRADVTVTFGFAKRGLYLYPGCDYSGHIMVADIGISDRSFFGHVPQVFVYDENPLTLFPERQGNGNKGTFGKVLLVAGFEQMAGAAVLSAKAALGIGSGMVKVICSPENREILQTSVPEVLYDTCENIQNSLKWADVVAIGPGLGKSEAAWKVLKEILEFGDHPLVLDADALNLISESEILQKLVVDYKGIKIMTPHIGELAWLTGKSVSVLKDNIFETAMQCAVRFQAIMVCKDARTVVAAPSDAQLYLNISGNSGMATAGSGDVLTGIIAGLLGQKTDAFQAATIGVYLHGVAGDRTRDIYTEYGVTAGRMAESIQNLNERKDISAERK